MPGGFGDRGFEGKVLTAQYARETGIPYFGICYGMQAAVVDFARHVAGLEGANSTENDKASPHPVIGLITEWRTAIGEVERRNEDSDLGGTMRLGLQDQRLKPGTLARELYGKDVVGERHRHRYEFNNRYRTQLEDAGLVICGQVDGRPAGGDGRAAEAQHPWFLACQAHPEFLSTPRDGHPLFIGFIRAAREHKAQAGGRLLKEATRMKLCGFEVGLDQPFFLIAGPCVIESMQLQLDTAGKLKEITGELGIPFIFKSSFDKANRTSGTSFRGPGLEEGLKVLAEVKRQLGVPVLTDVHEYTPMDEVRRVVDVLQTPAFLCRQTDFIQKVASAGKPVNIKKGQFLSPWEMKHVTAKAQATGNTADHGLRARRQLRLQQPGLRHALAERDARHRLPGGVRRHPFGAAARRHGRQVRRPARVRAGAVARGDGGRHRRHLHGNASGPGQGAGPTAPTPGRCRRCARCWRR